MDVGLPDETTWVLPASWRKTLHPRRGGVPVPPREADPEAVETVRAWTAHLGDVLRKWFDAPQSESELVDATRAWLSGEVNPLGAAVVVAVADRTRTPHDQPRLTAFADAWITTHGIVFAAEAVAELTRIAIEHHGPITDLVPSVRLSQPHGETYGWPLGTELADRLRAVLASASSEDYEQVVVALKRHRSDEFQRVVVSYLVPTERRWVDETCSALPEMTTWRNYRSLLLCSVHTVDQANLLRERGYFGWSLPSADELYSLADAVGPELVPLLAAEADRAGGHERKLRLDMLAEIPTDQAFWALLARLDQKHVPPVTVEAMRRYPVRALRMLANTVMKNGKTADPARQLLRAHVLTNPGLAARVADELPEDVRTFLVAFGKDNEPRPEAPPEKLPRLLVEPPWLVKRKTAKPIVLKRLVAPPEVRTVWEEGEREAWGRIHIRHSPWAPVAERLAQKTVALAGLDPSERAGMLVEAPEEFVRPLLPDYELPVYWLSDGVPMRVAARFGGDALPLVLPAATSHPATAGEVLLPFLSEEVAATMADWLVRLKSARGLAVTWLTRHGVEAARLLIPMALGAAGRARRNAEAALRLLRTTGRSADVTEAARGYGPEAEAGIRALLDTDPLDLVPARMPAIGAWAYQGVLPQILLRDKESALSLTATRRVLAIASLCKPGEKYAGIDVVIEACDPDSLSEFAWAAFRGWQTVHMPAKDSWAFVVLGWFGNDDVARRLSPIIRAWPGEGGHQRAVAGLDVLATIGTDTALMQLHAISQKVKFKGLKVRAQEKMAEVAAELGLSAEQLADRLVPNFGLDEDASLVIDYGQRKFVVGFDEQLKPYVTEEGGKPRKDLPKPGAKDDQELAPAEHKRFAQLKKDVRSIALDQVQRLERAMVTGRTWTGTEFRELLAGHPLLWHIVRRLVWLSESEGEVTAFRLAEDRTFADGSDDEFTLPDTAVVSVAHPLKLGDTVGAWSELFADYEILQPFPQLGRHVQALGEEDREARTLERFEKITVNVGKVLGLQKRGWVRARPEDGGMEPGIRKPVGDGWSVMIDLDPGIAVAMVNEFPEQTLECIWLNDAPDLKWNPRDGVRFGELDAVTASELLADLADLTS
jgi:uncharacterized protein DUF4132